MTGSEEQLQDAASNLQDPKDVPISDIVAHVWQRRRWLGKVIGIGTLVTLGLAFLVPNEYTSTAQLMPPDQQMLSGTSMLGALTGAGISLPSVGSSLMNQRTPGGTSIAILGSRTVQDDIINQFDLRSVYHCKYYVDARKELTKRTVLDEDRKSGIVSIAVTDHDRNRARDIALAYVDELDKLVNSLSTSSARRERIFLEGRLNSIKDDLDQSSRALSQFSSRNATFDPQKQGEATVEAAGKLQGELISAQGELSGLKAMYSDENVRVREVRARINELESQLRKISGQGQLNDATDLKSDELMPSVRKIPLLGFTYYDLYRQVTMDESLYATLTKQYELAKVQEAKDIPPIKILDPPEAPERKSWPHRSIFLILGFLLSACFGTIWVAAAYLWDNADDSSPIKVGGREIKQLFKHSNAAR